MRSSAACWASGALLLAAAVAAADPAPDPGLADLMRRMASTPGVEARFREVRELALLAAPLESRGWLYFVPPDRLARFTLEPAFSALVAEGDRVRFREGEEEEAIDLSGSPTARVFVDHVVALWSGDLERLEALYTTEFEVDGPRWELSLAPRRAPLDRFVARIALRGDERGLREIAIDSRDGDRTTTFFEDTRVDRRFDAGELERLFSEGLPLPAAAGTP